MKDEKIIIFNLDCPDFTLNHPKVVIYHLKSLKSHFLRLPAVLVQFSPNDPIILTFNETYFQILPSIVKNVRVAYLGGDLFYSDGKFNYHFDSFSICLETIDQNFPDIVEFIKKLEPFFRKEAVKKISDIDFYRRLRNACKHCSGKMKPLKNNEFHSYYKMVTEMINMLSDPLLVELPMGTFDMYTKKSVDSPKGIQFDGIIFKLCWSCNSTMTIDAIKIIGQSALQTIRELIQQLQAELEFYAISGVEGNDDLSN